MLLPMLYSANDVNSNATECSIRLTEMLAAINVMKAEGMPEAEQYMKLAEEYYGGLTARGININLGN